MKIKNYNPIQNGETPVSYETGVERLMKNLSYPFNNDSAKLGTLFACPKTAVVDCCKI